MISVKNILPKSVTWNLMEIIMFFFIAIISVIFNELSAAGISHDTISNKTSLLTTFSYLEDTHLNARQLITKYGYRGETHRVTTHDGYILEMHRITGPNSNSKPNGKPVILLMHGLLCSSVDWLISGPGKAYAYLLADGGYDVWMGNARGNHFSRRHKKYSVHDKKFWMFSWHEMGYYDLPAMIDYIRGKTKVDKLLYVGHSQGTTSFFVMASERPEYNDKIEAMFAFAPVAYVKHMISPVFRLLNEIRDLTDTTLSLLGKYQFEPSQDFLHKVSTIACNEDAWTQPICENVIFLISGYGNEQMNKTLLPAILGHTPAGASTRQFFHYGQIIKSDKFRQFDYGYFKNWLKYKQSTPPEYDLSKVKVPVVLYYADNDWLSHVKDVDHLETKLPNVHRKVRVPYSKFTHLDYLWGIDAHKILYTESILLMKSFN